MDVSRLSQVGEYEWRIEPHGAMRVPGIIFADRALVVEMAEKVREQVEHVATLPGIVRASYAMPDAHWGYGFPIGGVAAFDPAAGGVVSAGGVGFDISCGVRLLRTGIRAEELAPHTRALVDALFSRIPAGVGSRGTIHLTDGEIDAMLVGGARWAVSRGWGRTADLGRIEEEGCMRGADPSAVSARAKQRQRDEMGTLGSGNHYLEVQRVAEVIDATAAAAFGLALDEIVVSIHCGSRGLGHQIGAEYLREMALAAPEHGLVLPDRELACAPIASPLGQRYLGAMRAGINCALANREIVSHLTRETFARVMPGAELELLYDVSHNTCKEEPHLVDGALRTLFVHRKGATRALGPGHAALPPALRATGQPVLIGGSMGTSSYVLRGTAESESRAFESACHGAGRRISRHGALREYDGRAIQDELAARGILVRSPSTRGIAEEAPGAYKDVRAVCEAAHHAGLARLVARLEPVVCIKG